MTNDIPLSVINPLKVKLQLGDLCLVCRKAIERHLQESFGQVEATQPVCAECKLVVLRSLGE
jgi:hypothetical protein